MADPNEPQKPQPGDTVEVFLRSIPVADHKMMLAYQEQAAIREGDLAVLRDIRAYRRRLDRKT